MKFLLPCLFSIVFLSACSKKEVPASGSDSILTKPVTEHAPEAQMKRDSGTGLLVDQTRLYSPQQQVLLARFDPATIVTIYHDFKAIRKPGITQEKIEVFTKSKKITTDELKAILEEGDRRGWGKQ